MTENHQLRETRLWISKRRKERLVGLTAMLGGGILIATSLSAGFNVTLVGVAALLVFVTTIGIVRSNGGGWRHIGRVGAAIATIGLVITLLGWGLYELGVAIGSSIFAVGFFFGLHGGVLVVGVETARLGTLPRWSFAPLVVGGTFVLTGFALAGFSVSGPTVALLLLVGGSGWAAVGYGFWAASDDAAETDRHDVPDDRSSRIANRTDGGGSGEGGPDRLHVDGRVTLPDEEPATAVVVTVYDHEPEGLSVLGETPVNDDGRYEIEYTDEDVRRLGKDRADLLVRAYNEAGIVVAESEIVSDVDADRTIDLEIESAEALTPSEYDRLRAEIQPLLEGIRIRDLTDDDIDFLAREIEVDDRDAYPAGRESIELLSTAEQLATETAVLAPVFYGLGRLDHELDPEALASAETETLHETLVTAIEDDVIPADLRDELDDELERLRSVDEPPMRHEPDRWADREATIRLVDDDTDEPLDGYTAQLVGSADIDPGHTDRSVTNARGQVRFPYRSRVDPASASDDGPATPPIELRVFDHRGDERARETVTPDPDGVDVRVSASTPDRPDEETAEAEEALAEMRVGDEPEADPSADDADEEAIHLLAGSETGETLAARGYTTASDVVAESPTTFARSVGDDLDAAEAERMHTITRVRTAATDSVAMNGLTTEATRRAIDDGADPSDERRHSMISPRAYLGALETYTEKYVTRTDSDRPRRSQKLDAETLSELFHQPFEDLTTPTELTDDPVRFVRLCVESLLGYLGDESIAEGIDDPTSELGAAMDRYRTDAYDELLRRWGTSRAELRRAAHDDEERDTAADRLGIEPYRVTGDESGEHIHLRASADPDDPDALSEEALQRIFGLPALTETVDGSRGVRDPLEAIDEPALRTWRIDHLYRTWEDATVTTDAFADGDRPVIDPDVIGPDDFRDPDPDRSDAFDIWLTRRHWVDRQLETLRDLLSDLRTAFEELTAADAIEYDGRTFDGPWRGGPSPDEFEHLYDRLVGGDDADEVTELIRTDLHLEVGAFTRLVELVEKHDGTARTDRADSLTADERDELASILVVAMKASLADEWIDEEIGTVGTDARPGDLLDPRRFWIATREPERGEWSSRLTRVHTVEERPFVDPIHVDRDDLPEEPAGRRVRELYDTRSERLERQRSRLETVHHDAAADANENPFDEVLRTVFRDLYRFEPFAASNWRAYLETVRDELDDGNEEAGDVLEMDLHVSREELDLLVEVSRRSSPAFDGDPPADSQLAEAIEALLPAAIWQTAYDEWIAEEESEGITEYWQALKARLPTWRASTDDRRRWQEALQARSEPPVIDPDLLRTEEFFVGDETLEMERWEERRDQLEEISDGISLESGLDEALTEIVGVSGSTLADLSARLDRGENVSVRLEQLTLSADAAAYLAGMHAKLDDGASLTAEEREDVRAIVTGVWKRRAFATWRREERSDGIILSPKWFKVPSDPPDQLEEDDPMRWRFDRSRRRQWTHTLETRIDQVDAVDEQLADAIAETEEDVLPEVRDRLVAAIDPIDDGSFMASVEWLSDRLLVDLRSESRQGTTRVDHAIDSIQALLVALDIGRLDGGLADLDLELTDDYFEQRWDWLGTYSRWKSAMGVYLYPENVLLPTLRRQQSPAFEALADEITATRSISHADVTDAVGRYSEYFEDVGRLEPIAACMVGNPDRDQRSRRSGRRRSKRDRSRERVPIVRDHRTDGGRDATRRDAERDVRRRDHRTDRDDGTDGGDGDREPIVRDHRRDSDDETDAGDRATDDRASDRESRREDRRRGERREERARSDERTRRRRGGYTRSHGDSDDHLGYAFAQSKESGTYYYRAFDPSVENPSEAAGFWKPLSVLETIDERVRDLYGAVAYQDAIYVFVRTQSDDNADFGYVEYDVGSDTWQPYETIELPGRLHARSSVEIVQTDGTDTPPEFVVDLISEDTGRDRGEGARERDHRDESDSGNDIGGDRSRRGESGGLVRDHRTDGGRDRERNGADDDRRRRARERSGAKVRDHRGDSDDEGRPRSRERGGDDADRRRQGRERREGDPRVRVRDDVPGRGRDGAREVRDHRGRGDGDDDDRRRRARERGSDDRRRRTPRRGYDDDRRRRARERDSDGRRDRTPRRRDDRGRSRDEQRERSRGEDRGRVIVRIGTEYYGAFDADGTPPDPDEMTELEVPESVVPTESGTRTRGGRVRRSTDDASRISRPSSGRDTSRGAVDVPPGLPSLFGVLRHEDRLYFVGVTHVQGTFHECYEYDPTEGEFTGAIRFESDLPRDAYGRIRDVVPAFKPAGSNEILMRNGRDGFSRITIGQGRRGSSVEEDAHGVTGLYDRNTEVLVHCNNAIPTLDADGRTDVLGNVFLRRTSRNGEFQSIRIGTGRGRGGPRRRDHRRDRESHTRRRDSRRGRERDTGDRDHVRVPARRGVRSDGEDDTDTDGSDQARDTDDSSDREPIRRDHRSDGADGAGRSGRGTDSGGSDPVRRDHRTDGGGVTYALQYATTLAPVIPERGTDSRWSSGITSPDAARSASSQAEVRTASQELLEANQPPDRRTNVPYVAEAFYFVPLFVARKLTQSGDFETALEWFRTVYDYTRASTTDAPVWHGLVQEHEGTRLRRTASGIEWLKDPLIPHSIAQSRRYPYTQFTVFSIVQCLLEMADEEFTRDTSESVARARILYDLVVDLLDDVVDAMVSATDRPVTRVRARVGSDSSSRSDSSSNSESAADDGRSLLEAVERGAVSLSDVRETLSSDLRVREVVEEIDGISDDRGGGESHTRLAVGSRTRPRSSDPVRGYRPERWAGVEALQIRSGFRVPTNPLFSSLRLHATNNLDKIRSGRNIAGLERPVEPRGASTSIESVAPTLTGDGRLSVPETGIQPTNYRYDTLIGRARELADLARQIESEFFATLERIDQESYQLKRAEQDVELARAGVRLQDLRVEEARESVTLSGLERERAEIRADHYSRLVHEGLLGLERQSLQSMQMARDMHVFAAQVGGMGAVASAFLGGNPLSGISSAASSGAAAASTQASILQTMASFERREQEWEHQEHLAKRDVRIGSQQIQLARTRVDIVARERNIAALETTHAEDITTFHETKFTNRELYRWMSGILERVYRYFLQQATSMARLAETQLAFERQERPPRIVRSGYWDAPRTGRIASSDDDSEDRRGLTGSARLLKDIVQLDQYKFETDERMHRVEKTISLAQLDPLALQRFRETGVLRFGTPMELFDRDHPGHYFRLVKNVDASVIALTPPTDGIKATLTASGLSRIVVGDHVFRKRVIRRHPESIVLRASQRRDHVTDFQPEDGAKLRPFENMGVESSWELRMPKPANQFDYDTIADVLVTIEYASLDSTAYRQQVTEELDSHRSIDRVFSFKADFADQWYDLHNPGRTAKPMTVRFETERGMFPPNLSDVVIDGVQLYFLGEDERFDDLDVTLTVTERGRSGRSGGVARPLDGVIRTPTASSWNAIRGSKTEGTWTLSLPTTGRLRELFDGDHLEDLLFVVTVSGELDEWPT